MIMLYAYGDASIKKEVKTVARKAVESPLEYDRHSQWMLIYELYRSKAIKSCGMDKQYFDVLKAGGVKFCSVI